MEKGLQTALWVSPATRMIAEPGFELRMSVPPEHRHTDPEAVLEALLSGSVEVALLPLNLALTQIRHLDLLPAVAISSCASPFDCVAFEALSDRSDTTVVVEPGQEYAGLIAEIVLKEHYGVQASRSAPDAPSAGGRIVGIGPAERTEDVNTLDLAREWYELTNYPLVWAVFASRRGESNSGMIRAVRDDILDIETARLEWAGRLKPGAADRHFYEFELKFRLDDVAVAAMTELCEYLYYYGDTEEIPTFSLASIQESENG